MRGINATELSLAVIATGIMLSFFVYFGTYFLSQHDKQAERVLQNYTFQQELLAQPPEEFCKKTLYFRDQTEELENCLDRYQDSGRTRSQSSQVFCEDTLGFFPGTPQLRTCLHREKAQFGYSRSDVPDPRDRGSGSSGSSRVLLFR